MAQMTAVRRSTGRMPSAPGRTFGNWKLAYADFLTALVAFFLVMWLAKGLPESGRADLAGYFRSGPAIETETDAPTDLAVPTTIAPDPGQELVRRLARDPLFADRGLGVSTSADGARVRIDLVDRRDDPLFVAGGADLTKAGRGKIEALTRVILSGNWPLEIEGHTDAFPFHGPGGSNWTLSSARAHAARRALTASGVPQDRIRAVSGRADTAPLRPSEPHLSANRRITVVLQVRQ